MEKLIENLKELGLNTYESKVYIALLKKNPATGYEISKLSEVPQARTYDTLNVLAKKGIVTQTAEKPIKYIPIKPKELTKNYKKKVSQNLDYLDKYLPDVKLNTFNPITSITNYDEIISKIIDMISSAKKTIYLIIWAKDFKIFEQELLNAYNRNVEIRIISFEKLHTNFGLVYEHPFAKKIESNFNGRYIAIACDDKEAIYGRIESNDNSTHNVIWTQNFEMVFLIKEFIVHDMIILDIQSTFTKELMYTYGTGMKHLHDKILGADNIYKVK